MELTKTDLNFVLTHLPKDVRTLIEENPVYLGGGFIRAIIAGEKPSDIDLFGKSKEALQVFAYKLSNSRGVKVHETQNSITLLCNPRLAVQFITRWVYNTAEGVMASFDFTVCQAVVWYDLESGTWKSAVSEGFYCDLAARRLVYTMPQRNEDVGGSILRVRKYLSRGYNIQANSLGKCIARFVKGVRWESLLSFDEAEVGIILTGLLREVDPSHVIDGVEIADEHEIIVGE
jgi:hypothetical protein